MKENRNNHINTDLRSREWLMKDIEYAGRPFVNAGFRNTEEVLELRIYDMLNILGIDRIMAEEMMYALYYFFNENSGADSALYEKALEQYFDYKEWHRKHPDMAQVKVKDIVLAEGINMKALEWLFGQAVRKFWKSGEYNSREYRYFSYMDMLGKGQER